MSSEDVKSAGTLGFVGSILALIPDLNIVGYILLLIAMNKLSKVYNNDNIWRNAIYALIVAIIGGILIAISLVSVFALFGMIFQGNFGILTGFIIVIIIIVYVLNIVSGYFWRNAYAELAKSSGINDFQNAAKWIWLGALLSIILVGVLLYIIGQIYAMRGLSKIKESITL